jgi:hypothetical protein
MHFQPVFGIDFLQTTCWWNTLRELLGAPWLQNLILAVTAAIGLWTLGASSRQERRRATVDVLLATLDDKDSLDTRIKVKALIEAGLDIPVLLSKEGGANRRLILSILSRYEFMAAGLREGAFDEPIYQRMYYTNIIDDWDNLEAFIVALRIQRKTQTPFQELQQLVLRWKKHPLKAYSELSRQTEAPQPPPAQAPPGKAGASTSGQAGSGPAEPVTPREKQPLDPSQKTD